MSATLGQGFKGYRKRSLPRYGVSSRQLRPISAAASLTPFATVSLSEKNSPSVTGQQMFDPHTQIKKPGTRLSWVSNKKSHQRRSRDCCFLSKGVWSAGARPALAELNPELGAGKAEAQLNGDREDQRPAGQKGA